MVESDPIGEANGLQTPDSHVISVLKLGIASFTEHLASSFVVPCYSSLYISLMSRRCFVYRLLVSF